MPDLRRKFLVAFLVVGAVVLPLWPSFERPGLWMDEGALLVYPELMRHGEIPYRDFETFYGPANAAVLSVAYAITGPNIMAERAVGLLYRILILAALFAFAQRRSTILAAGAVILAGIMLVPFGLPAYAWVGAVACALWSLWFALQINSPARCLIAGVLASSTLLFRPDLGPGMLAAALPLFLLMQPARRWNFAVGSTLGLLPYGWLMLTAGPAEVMNNLFIYPVLHCNAGRHLPLLSAQSFVLGLFVLHLAAVGVNLSAGVIGMIRDRTDVFPRLLLGLAFLALGMTHQAAQRLDSGHIVSAALLSLTILPLALLGLRAKSATAPLKERYAFGAFAGVLLSLLLIAPNLGINTLNKIIDSVNGGVHYAVFVEHRGRSFPLRSAQAAFAVDTLLTHLDVISKPGQRLFVGPANLRRTNYNDTYLYHLMPQLQPAGYFFEMNPLSANRPNSRLARDVASADWLVLSHYWDDWKEPNESMKDGPEEPMFVVRNQFVLCGKYEGYDLYRRRIPVAVQN